jgi:hypothetical protein
MKLKHIEYILGIIAVIGASELEREALANSLTSLSIILIVASIAPGFIVYAYMYYSKPKAQREIEHRLKRRAEAFEFDVPWFMVLATALVPESLFGQIQWGYLWIGVAIAATLVLFLKTRTAWGTHILLTLPIYVAASMGAPFSVVAVVNPNILASYFPHQLDIVLSRRIAILFAIAEQTVLIGALGLLMGNLWRNSVLRKNRISENHFAELNETVARKIVKYHPLSGLQDPLSDIADTIRLFQRAEFRAMVGWGWSIIDRILIVMGPRTDKKRTATTLGVRSQFDFIYEKRNRTVHEGYSPTVEDAVGLLRLLSEIVVAISKIDDSWFARTGRSERK